MCSFYVDVYTLQHTEFCFMDRTAAEFLNPSETLQVQETVQHIKSGWKKCPIVMSQGALPLLRYTSQHFLLQLSPGAQGRRLALLFPGVQTRNLRKTRFHSILQCLISKKKEEIVFPFPVMSYIYALQSSNV